MPLVILAAEHRKAEGEPLSSSKIDPLDSAILQRLANLELAEGVSQDRAELVEQHLRQFVANKEEDEPRGAASAPNEQGVFFDIQVQVRRVEFVTSDPLILYFSLYDCETQQQVSEDSARNVDTVYKRPFGVAVWPCASVSDPERNGPPIQMWLSSGREDHLEDKLSAILTKLRGGNRVSSSTGGANAKAIILTSQCKSHKEHHLHNPQNVRIMQIDPFISPLVVRNDYYIRLKHGVFQQDRKRAARNVEAKVYVVAGDGKVLPGVIGRQRAALSDTYRSIVYYHDNTPHFEEQLLLRLPVGNANASPPGLHVLFVFSHVSTTVAKSHPFAFTFLPLFHPTSSAIAQEGAIKLKCYAPLPGVESVKAQVEDLKYLKFQPILRDGVIATAEPNLRPKESVHISIQACSTEVPTNRTLASLLLACRTIKPGRTFRATVEPLLEFAMDELEVHDALQHMREFLDALFRTMDAVEDDLLVQQAFSALVSFLSRAALALGRKQFRRRFEQYAEEHFMLQSFAPRVYFSLLGNLRLWLELSPLASAESNLEVQAEVEATRGKGLRRRAMSTDVQESGAVLRCLAYLLRLILLSRRSDVTQVSNKINAAVPAQAPPRSSTSGPTFQQHVLDIFYLLDELVTSKVQLETSSSGTENLATALKRAAMTGMAEVVDFSLLDGLRDDILEVDTISEIARGFLDSIADAPPELRPGKLVYLQSLCASPGLLSRWDLRRRLSASVIRSLQRHLRGDIEEQTASLECVERMFSTVQQRDNALTSVQRREDIWNAALLLPDIFHAARGFIAVRYPETARSQPRKYASFLLSHLSADLRDVGMRLLLCAFSIVLDLDSQQLKYFMSSALEETQRTADVFMQDALICCNAFLHEEAADADRCFPDSWFSVSAGVLRSVLSVLEWFSPRLVACFRGASARADLARPDKSLWLLFVHAGLCLGNHSILCGEETPNDAHKRHILQQENLVTAHVRLTRVLRGAWDGPLRGQRWLMAQHLTLKVLKLCISLHASEDLVSLARKMYLDMVCETLTKATEDMAGVMERVTTAFVDAASRSQDSLALERAAELFGTTLLQSAPAEMQEDRAVALFLDDMAQLCALLRALERLPRLAAFEIDRVESIVELLNYLRRQQRDEQFLGYLDELVSLHEELGNAEEAVNARLLRLQVRGQDRESVLWDVLRTCERGKLWERGITVLDELRDVFERAFQTSRISRVLLQQAGFFDSLARDQRHRYYPSYYRVRFVGPASFEDENRLGASSVWNRTFVYKGNDMEGLSEFCVRLGTSFEGVTVLQAQGRIDSSARQTESERWIEVQTVKPSTWFETALLAQGDSTRLADGADDMQRCLQAMRVSMQGAHITEAVDAEGVLPPARVLQQQAHAKIESVSHLSSFRKREEKSGNEFLDTWARKYIIELDAPGFPCLSRRLPVTRQVIYEIDPLRIAIQTIQNKNCELVEHIADNSRREGRDAPQAFTMLLCGVVDAAVSGGVTKNYGSLLSGSFTSSYPEIVDAYGSALATEPWVGFLRELVRMQVNLVEKAVDVHGRVCAEAVLPLHAHLKDKMADLKSEIGNLLSQ
ncbi:Dedicator of cytokinesis protein 4 [Hondaea fermentalgiana]|uniref:Dedicator of cytokinesis protein 4 n=1 Tax=Hondaea fermentalgiana TaxID=2315210 RepID=A0A2R5GAA8_9STRA|nr:Dedicator of cytokinesis protein 4 [Hondaea fermentalgiana]|eukprot:GBG27957.1 Dedicator of cytokinesis protein 4 [Hondaea fermentalgiana]